MRRPLSLMCALAFALAVAACSADEPSAEPTASTAPSPFPASGPTSETTASATGASGSPAPGSPPDVRLPGDMSAVVGGPADVLAISGGDLTPLVPDGSMPTTSTILARPAAPIDQIAVAWRAGEPPPGRTGLIVWQRAAGDPAWRAVYAFTDPPAKGVFGVRMDQADVTRDGIADLLTFEDVGGSGACGTYRVIASAEGDAGEILRRSVCDTEIQMAGGGLRVREAVFEPDDPHCCPSSIRTTVLRWSGSHWREVSSEVSPVPGTA